jgi:hypothetical protein
MFTSRRTPKYPVTTREKVWTKPNAIAHSQRGDGINDDSKKLRTFFEKGNAYTLKKLQDHFAAAANLKK